MPPEEVPPARVVTVRDAPPAAPPADLRWRTPDAEPPARGEDADDAFGDRPTFVAEAAGPG